MKIYFLNVDIKIIHIIICYLLHYNINTNLKKSMK